MKILIERDLDEAASLLRQGELVAFPTETVYGLGGHLFIPEAIQKIFQVKGRPADNPLIVHISSLEQIEQIAQELSSDFLRLAEVFFPGPLTLVVKRHPSVPESVSCGLETIAVRMPKHPLARTLIEKVGAPLAAPSANLSGKPSATSIAHVQEDFSGKIAAALDGGVCSLGIESTVLSFVSGNEPRLLRPGVITKEMLESLLGKKIEGPRHNEKVLSPGMKYRHYAPQAKVFLFKDEEEMRTHQEKEDRRCLIITPTMQTLYALLRQADHEAYEEIHVLLDASIMGNPALLNRLEHASH